MSLLRARTAITRGTAAKRRCQPMSSHGTSQCALLLTDGITSGSTNLGCFHDDDSSMSASDPKQTSPAARAILAK